MIWWSRGHELYDYYGIPHNRTLGFTYPPFAGITLYPLKYLSQSATYLTWSAAILVVFALCVDWMLTLAIARTQPWWLVIAAVAALFLMNPIRDTFSFGQINVFLAAAVLADARGLSDLSRWSGVGTGLATAVKLTPGIFIVYLVVTRRYRPAGRAILTALGVSLVAGAVAPKASLDYWTKVIFASNRIGTIGSPSNQSLYGFLTHLLNDDAQPEGHAPAAVWVVGCVLVIIVGFGRARRAAVAGDELAGFTLAGLVGGLVSPIAWIHHLFWIVPACIILFVVAYRSRSWWYWTAAVALYVCGSASLEVHNRHWGGHHYDGGLLGFVGEDFFPLASLFLICFLPIRRVPAESGLSDPGQSR